MLKVQGLDCPTEVDALRRGPGGRPGVVGLGFDLIHGVMTVDYEPGATDPARLVRRVAERAGMQATVLGEPEVARLRGGSRHGRWVATGGSGLALLAGIAARAPRRAGLGGAGRLRPGDRGRRVRAVPEGRPRASAGSGSTSTS